MSDSEEARCDKFDEVYLPFTEGELKKHFVPSESDHIAYYKKRLGKRNEHNERFWIVTTLKSLVDAHRGGNEALDHLLTGCIGEPPREYSDWRSALGEKYRLFFEVAMPAPQQYRAFLKDHYREVTLNFPLMMTPGPGTQYEGKTWVDAVLVGETGVAVLFEAKVLSDISCRVKYDFTRNQIARNIDVMLERGHGQSGVPLLRNREPLLTYFVLLTPSKFKRKENDSDEPDYHDSRLYGWLMEEYKRNPAVLAKHLHHRNDDGTVERATQRMGWLTFEDCYAQLPDSCPWMRSSV